MLPPRPSTLMAKRALIGALVLAQLLLFLLVGAVAAISFSGSPGGLAGGGGSVLLTVYTGTATIQRAGATVPVVAHSGDTLAAGDAVRTGAASKAGVSYPDGSLTRLDSDTRVVVSSVRAAGGAVKTSLQQSAGLTWNQVKSLVGGSTFKVSGPNSAVAEVRGTRFGYYVERDAGGNPVIWIDVWDGVVRVSGAIGSPVTAGSGQRVTVRPASAPTAPAAIPAADRQLSFTVFNRTIEAVTGTPVAFANGTSSTGDTSTSFPVTADGRGDLQLVLGWPGSTFELTVVDPSGKVFSRSTSAQAPLSVVAKRARAGRWTFIVRDIQSGPNEAWWVIVGRA
ncbi:MAG: FecR domain-containing protein [Chloroflexi bacterium]|nr:MAG: FecR domain-containing protein [Chloroflexota bacterium]